MLSGERGLNQLDSSEGFGLAERGNRLLRWKASVCLSAFWLYLPFCLLAVFAFLPIGLSLLTQRKMSFSSVITGGPKDSESSNRESFQAISAVKVEHFCKTRVRMVPYSSICGGKCLLLSVHLCEELTFATVSDRSCSFGG